MSTLIGDNLQKTLFMKKNWKLNYQSSAVNYGGYGDSNPYVPPLAKPEFIGTLYLKQSYTSLDLFLGPTNFLTAYSAFYSAPIYWFWGWIRGQAGATWYANSEAQGEQLYPTGLALFYDMHSWNGWITWATDALVMALWNLISFGPLNWNKLLPLFDGSVKTTNSDLIMWSYWGNYLLPGIGYWIKLWCFFAQNCQLEYGWIYAKGMM